MSIHATCKNYYKQKKGLTGELVYISGDLSDPSTLTVLIVTETAIIIMIQWDLSQ